VIDHAPELLRTLKRHGLPCHAIERVRPGGHVWRALGDGRAWSVQHAAASEAPAWRATARWLLRMNHADAPIARLWRPPKGKPRLLLTPSGTLLVTDWERGTPVAEEGWNPHRATALGNALAELHRHSSALEAPASARRYDGAWARDLIARFTALSAGAPFAPHTPPEEWARVLAGLRVAAARLERAWQRGPGGPLAMIHGDVHAGNVLLVEGEAQVRFIDVGRVGYGPLALDLAFALLEHHESTRWPLLRAYQERLGMPLAFERVDTPFRLLAAVDNLTFLASIEQEHPFITASWPELIATAQALSDLAGVGERHPTVRAPTATEEQL
jgi:thiamine kinase-like enzyme